MEDGTENEAVQKEFTRSLKRPKTFKKSSVPHSTEAINMTVAWPAVLNVPSHWKKQFQLLHHASNTSEQIGGLTEQLSWCILRFGHQESLGLTRDETKREHGKHHLSVWSSLLRYPGRGGSRDRHADWKPSLGFEDARVRQRGERERGHG